MSTTPYMDLTLPTVSVTEGPEYATELNAAFTSVDSHNHTSGQGVQVPTAGLNINADLTFGSYNATALRSSRYTAQLSPLALVTDRGCTYVSGVDLWFNDGSGNQIQLTASGALNAASIGGIGGDYATSTASVAYSDSTKTFKFLQDTNKSSLLDTGTILLRRTDITSSAATTIQANGSLTVGYTVTLPTAVPASLSFVAIDASGNLSFVNSMASLSLSGALTVGTTTTLSGLTATTVPYLNASKQLTSSAVTPTELGYVSGVTSAIQTQLNRYTNWGATAWTPTGTWSTNTTYTGQYRRQGDTGEFRVKVALAGAPTSATLDINLPAAHTIDTTKLTGGTADLTIMGICTIRDDSAGVRYPAIVTYATTTSVSLQAFFTDTHTGNANTKYNDVSQINPVTFANLDSVTVMFSAPIVEYA